MFVCWEISNLYNYMDAVTRMTTSQFKVRVEMALGRDWILSGGAAVRMSLL